MSVTVEAVPLALEEAAQIVDAAAPALYELSDQEERTVSEAAMVLDFMGGLVDARRVHPEALPTLAQLRERQAVSGGSIALRTAYFLEDAPHAVELLLISPPRR